MSDPTLQTGPSEMVIGKIYESMYGLSTTLHVRERDLFTLLWKCSRETCFVKRLPVRCGSHEGARTGDMFFQ